MFRTTKGIGVVGWGLFSSLFLFNLWQYSEYVWIILVQIPSFQTFQGIKILQWNIGIFYYLFTWKYDLYQSKSTDREWGYSWLRILRPLPPLPSKKQAFPVFCINYCSMFWNELKINFPISAIFKCEIFVSIWLQKK